jgi:hypothetical protein
MRVKDLPEISKLSIPEKILLVEDLWDHISADDSSIPVPESHKAELDKSKMMPSTAILGMKRNRLALAKSFCGCFMPVPVIFSGIPSCIRQFTTISGVVCSVVSPTHAIS